MSEQTTQTTYIANGSLYVQFDIIDGIITIKNVNRQKQHTLRVGDELLFLSNNSLETTDLTEYVVQNEGKNMTECLQTLFQMYEQPEKTLSRQLIIRRRVALVVATRATAGKTAAPATAKKRPRKQKKKLSNKIDSSFIDVDIDVIASEVESAATNNSRNSNMSVIDLSGESDEEDSKMHAVVASSSRVAAARGATTKPRSKKKKGKKIKRGGTRPRKETRGRSDSMSSLSANDDYGSDDSSSRYTANTGAPSAAASRSVASRSATSGNNRKDKKHGCAVSGGSAFAASGSVSSRSVSSRSAAINSTSSSKKKAPKTHVPQGFKDRMWKWEHTVTNGGRDKRPQISTPAVNQLIIGTEYQEFRNHKNNQHVKEWDSTQLRKFISRWFANNAKFRSRGRLDSGRSSASSQSGNSQSSQSTKSKPTKVPTSVKEILRNWGEENVDLYGVRKEMSIDDTAALRTSIQPQLINAGNQHVEHWTNNYWDRWIRERMSKFGTRIMGKNVGKDSDGVLGMCNICREKSPGLPGVNCPDCTIKIYHVNMLGINADGNVTYEYKDDDGERRQAVVLPGDNVMYSSNSTTKENGVRIQFHAGQYYFHFFTYTSFKT